MSVNGVSEGTQAILLTWNPEKYNQGGAGTQQYSTGLKAGEIQRWSCNTTKVGVGDIVYLIRLGVDPRGIVAKGMVTKASFIAEDWSDSTKEKRYIEFKVEELREDCASGLLPMLLLNAVLPEQAWSPQTSGISIKADFLPALKELWSNGEGKHSLRQLVEWSNTNRTARAEEWLGRYRHIVNLTNDIRDKRQKIDIDTLRKIWKESANGIAFVAQGTMGNDDFDGNKQFLTNLTKMIIAKPDVDTMQHVLAQWKAAVEKGKLSKVHHIVINRVFAAAAPQHFTTIVSKSQCRELLRVLNSQFQLKPKFNVNDDWVSISSAIVSCMQAAVLEADKVLENNIAMWGVFERSTSVQQGSLAAEPAILGNQINETTPDYAMSNAPLNQILYGPPGTGKTYATINMALSILDPAFLETNSNDRLALKKRFDALAATNFVRFVTFHQSFSYEDFVEGLRAVTNDEKQLEYLVESGVFKRLCDDARTQGAQLGMGVRSNPRIWKISIDGTGPGPTKTYCFINGEARIGWGETGDLKQLGENNDYYKSLASNTQGTLRYFSDEIMPGDILLCIHSADMIDAVGVVTGEYHFDKAVPSGVISTYNHVRPVNWLFQNLQLPISPLNDGNLFIAKTVYRMDRVTWGDLLGYLEKSGAKPTTPSVSIVEREPYVLIIDEINRGNISRILGELITLIEPSKREGASEALSVQLPYSKKPFSVPSNVYLIGTMNTADRSLAGLDIALRRRFTFKEMPPRPDLLEGVLVEGVNVGELLGVMNQRIEVLLDRDHCLGHAYFMPLLDDPSLMRLGTIFRNQIIPLLQEYFFEDWQRIQWVLNDHRKAAEDCFLIQPNIDHEKLFGDGIETSGRGTRWSINESAFERASAYRGVIKAGQ